MLQTISPNLVQCNCSSGFGQFLFLFSFFNFCVLLLVLCVVWGVCSRFSWMRPRFGCSPGPPLPRTPLPRTAQNFALFSFSRHNFLSFFPLFWGPFVEFWWSFGRLGPSNVHVWDLGLSSGGFGASRVSNDSPRTPNVHISGPGDSKHHPKFNERTPKRGRKERKLWQERKKGQNFGPPTHPSGPHFCMNCVCPPRRTEGGGGFWP